MARSRLEAPQWQLNVAILLLAICVPVRALYFYMDGSTPKCFHEELPKDTLVVGRVNQAISYPRLPMHLTSPSYD